MGPRCIAHLRKPLVTPFCPLQPLAVPSNDESHEMSAFPYSESNFATWGFLTGGGLRVTCSCGTRTWALLLRWTLMHNKKQRPQPEGTTQLAVRFASVNGPYACDEAAVEEEITDTKAQVPWPGVTADRALQQEGP